MYKYVKRFDIITASIFMFYEFCYQKPKKFINSVANKYTKQNALYAILKTLCYTLYKRR